MKIVIAGGSGQIGGVLSRWFGDKNDQVVILSRGSRPSPWPVVFWDGRSLGEWTRELEGADAVINLAGESVNCRYGAENRRRIMDSRVHSTAIIGTAIRNVKHPPRVWLQASTATIYAHRFDSPNDEATGVLGGNEPNAPDTWRFSIDVAKAWERTLDEAHSPVRTVKMRSAIVMNPEKGSPFHILLKLARSGLGGSAGSGKQYVSWVHHRDFARAVDYLIHHDDLDGAVNIASPNPLPNVEFMRELRKAAGVPFGLPANRWMLEFGAFFLRTETELILKSRRVVPRRLLDHGFSFDFPEWPAAVRDLVKQL